MHLAELHQLREPVFDEQWYAGTYLVAGLFFLNGANLTPSILANAVTPLYEQTKKQRRRAWPRGLSGYYIIPIFSAPSFSDEIVNLVRTRMNFRWAIWPEPVLYRTIENTVERRADYGRHGRAFYPYITTMIGAGVGAAAMLAGHQFPCAVNGHPIPKAKVPI